jgi:tetratricopeptide (TPR) repeat protein
LRAKSQGNSLKKETIIAAVVFFSVGFLAGYVYHAQSSSSNSSAPESQASAPDASPQAQDQPSAFAAGTPDEAPEAQGRDPRLQALPPGHPPVDAASAIKVLERQAAARPGDPRPQLELANFLYDHKQFEQAVLWYQKALKLDPRNASARTDLGTSYYNLGRADEALREYRKSLEIDPRHQPTLYNMVLVNLEGTHNFAAARQAWEQLHGLNPQYPGLDRLKQSLDTAEGSRQ